VDKICEPIELSDQDLDNVAGGAFAFSSNSIFSNAFTTNSDFGIGVLQGDNSSAFGIFIGQLNIYFGTPMQLLRFSA
jgi:hypothetical protein